MQLTDHDRGHDWPGDHLGHPEAQEGRHAVEVARRGVRDDGHAEGEERRDLLDRRVERDDRVGGILGGHRVELRDLESGEQVDRRIARDADAKGFGRVLQVPFLAATFIAGPVGLLGWLFVREPAARAMAKRAK